MKGVKILGLGKAFGKEVLFQNVSLSFPQKGFFAIVGESGGGKTTLLNLISGLDEDYQGSIEVLGTPLRRLSSKELTEFRLHHIGYVRQGFDLLELETSLSNVKLPLEAISKETDSIKKKRSLDLLRYFSFPFPRKTMNKVSGGEKQRVTLARSLASNVDILLADEPTSALDIANRKMVYELLQGVSKEKLVIMVSHDLSSARTYCDNVFLLRDGSFYLEKEDKNIVSSPHLVLVKDVKRKKASHVPLFVWLQHSFHLLKEKKERSYFSLAILSFSLLSLGTSIYLGNDIKNEISSSFSSLFGDCHLIVEKVNLGEGALGTCISAPSKDIEGILANGSSFIEDYGVSYEADFNSYFVDENDAYIPNGASKLYVPGFSAISINDYLWMEENEEIVYPSRPSFLEDDEIVLGLPFSSMVNLALGLHLYRNYEDLGDYIADSPLPLILNVRNDSWTYDDEQLFSVVGVCQSDVLTIYHTNHLWNSVIYEDRMCFPTSNEPDASLPWIMQKTYYVKPSVSPFKFREEIRKDERLDSYVFEKANAHYNNSHCSDYALCDMPRYYVYLADKHSLSPSKISSIANDVSLPSYIVGGERSYGSFASGLMKGFVYPFFASPKSEELNSVINSISYVPIENKNMVVEKPPSVVEGSYLDPSTTSLSLSNDFSNIVQGRKPQKIDEVCISSELVKKWGDITSLNLAGLADENEEGEYCSRDYRVGQVKVVGVISSPRYLLGVLPYFPSDYFSEVLGVSAFSLESSSLLFMTPKSFDSEKVIAKLSHLYPLFRFYDPSEEVNESLLSTLNYVKITLNIASITTLSLSLLLLLVMGVIQVEESSKESYSLFLLGLSKDDIASSLTTSILIPITLATIFSTFLLFIVEKVIHEKIAEQFSATSLPFVFDIKPCYLIILVSVLTYVLFDIGINYYIFRKNFTLRKE
jgi:ABC-type lipoprotein export system ATPase subunit